MQNDTLQNRLTRIFDDAGGSDTLIDLLNEFEFESSRELAEAIVLGMAGNQQPPTDIPDAPALEPGDIEQRVETPRWKAIIYYRSETTGLVDVEYGIEELEELQDIVERGPDWNSIDKIVIVLDRKSSQDMTIEEAVEQ